MYQFLVIAHAIIAVFLTIVVLIQPGKGGGLVMGGGSQTLFGATGAGNFFTKLTTVLVICLVFTSIMLTKSQSHSSRSSLFDNTKTSAPTTAPLAAPAAPATPTTPATNTPATNP
jgi:preprotein translocase subunit SecG